MAALPVKGNPNDDVWQSMKVGGLLEVDFDRSDLSAPEVHARLREALGSAQCRVRELKYVGSGKGWVLSVFMCVCLRRFWRGSFLFFL